MKKTLSFALALSCITSCCVLMGCGKEDGVTDQQEMTSQWTDETYESDTESAPAAEGSKESMSIEEESAVSESDSETAAATTISEESALIEATDEKESEPEETVVNTMDGSYVSINGNGNEADIYRMDVDAGIADVLEDGLGYWIKGVELENNAFTIFEEDKEYSGIYSLEDGKIVLEYHSYKNNRIGSTVSVGDVDTGEMWQKKVLEDLANMNNTGTYLNSCIPSVYLIDRSIDYRMYPHFMRRYGYMRTENEVVLLEHHGDFLCVETYGFELSGSYVQGAAFEIIHNPVNTILDDLYSIYYTERMDSDFLNKQAELYGRPGDTTLKFADGKWTWYDNDGGLINDGLYQESSNYPGLIMLTITEDSANVDTSSRAWLEYSSAMPLLLYIDNNEIYYPGFVCVK